MTDSRKEFVLRTATFLESDLPVAVLRRAPQPVFPLHSHEFSELVIIYEGTGEHYTADSRAVVNAGDVFLINAGMFHGYRALRNLKLVNIVFDLKNLESPLSDLPMFPSFQVLLSLEPLFNRERAARLKLDREPLAAAMNIAAELEKETSHERPGSRMMSAALFMQLVALLIRSLGERVIGGAAQEHNIGPVLDYLNRRYRETTTVARLAKQANTSESTLTRAFHRIVGCSPITYLNRLRVHKAILLLKKPDLNIAEVAAMTGFEDSNYFSRVFRQITGMSPRDYRRNRKLKPELSLKRFLQQKSIP